MAEQQNSPNGPAQAAAKGQAPVQLRVVGQFIRDLSFENPNIERLFEGPGENPNLQVEVNVAAVKRGADIYQTDINFKATASSKLGTIYLMELVYGGLFKVDNIPPQQLEPFLLINCPTILFPFMRRIVADVTRDGGFPPLWLDPIDFGALFLQRAKAQAQSKPASPAAEKSKA
jgi:preprotein translocase subunit SecB